MSLILEALRKSEAERHQESLPESFARQQALLYTAKKQGPYWPWVICALLLINLAILGYFVFQANATTVSNDPEQQKQSNSTANLSFAAKLAEDDSSILLAAGEDEPGAAFAETTLSVARAELAKYPMTAVGSAAGRLSSPEKVIGRSDHLMGISEQPQSVPELETELEPEPELIAPARKQKNGELSATNNEVLVSTAEAATYQPRDAVNGINSVPHINELDRAFLNTLPKLVFNSHIYSRQAVGRRIMINDNYLREGEGFSGIKVFEITEDGVVLAKHGQKFLVPVVRDWSPAN